MSEVESLSRIKELEDALAEREAKEQVWADLLRRTTGQTSLDFFVIRWKEIEAELIELRRYKLLRMMRDFSELECGVGWMTGLEDVLKDIVASKDPSIYREEFFMAHWAAGGWWVWNEEKGEPVFVADEEEK